MGAGERFEILGPMGTGSMCNVQRARDRKHGELVALKTLQHLDANTLYRLKQEFRTLSRYEHPNLVQYLEMGQAANGLYVAMELVEGVDFLTWCRGPGDRQSAESATIGKTAAHRRLLDDSDDGAAQPWPATPLAGAKPPDLLKLRSAIGQLAEGIQTLHLSGRLHRDLKPSNVLVTPAGRLVVLDFGLVAEIDQDYTDGTLVEGLAGSAAYMSPEQAVGAQLGAASDWYGVGVMLYEALTGVWPFHGQLYPILLAKQRYAPTAPGVLVPGTPADLDGLCMRLLDRDPSARPAGTEVLAALRAHRPLVAVGAGKETRAKMRFRETQLGLLIRAVQGCKAPRTTVVHVRGADGSGRSLLLRELVKLVRRRERVLTLKARCSGFESVPFQVIDDLVDNASRVLRRQGSAVAEALSGPEIQALGAVFPVLGRVEELDLGQRVGTARREDLEKAPEGLRALLRALCGSHLVLVGIDDAHDGDEDSARMLGWALAHEPKLPLLVVLASREEGGRFTEILVEYATRWKCAVSSIDLPPLTDAQARALASEALGVEPHDPRVDRLVEAGPRLPKALFAAISQGGTGAGPEATVDDVTLAQVHTLPRPWRGLLEVLSLEPRGLPVEILVAAGGLGPDTFNALTSLRALRLVRVNDAAGETLAVNGERLRDWVYANSSPSERRVRHATVASALEAAGWPPDEALVRHWARAREPERAAVVAWRGAEQRVAARDDAGALPLLEKALELGKWTSRERRSVASVLAAVHARLGNASGARSAFRVAVENAASADRVASLRISLAEQTTLTGAVDEGISELEAVIRAAGGAPAAPAGGLLGRLLGRKPEEPRFQPIAESAQDPARAVRAAATWVAWRTVGALDRRRAEVFRGAHRREALALGDLGGMSRAESREAMALFEDGADEGPALARAEALADAARSPIARAWIELVRARISLCRGAWVDAARTADGAERVAVFRGEGSTVDRLELAITRVAGAWIAGEEPTLPELLSAPGAHDGDPRAAAVVALGWGAIGHLVALARGPVDRAPTAALHEQVQGIPRAWTTVALARLHLASGDARSAGALIRAERPAIDRAGAAGDPWLRAHLWATGAAAAAATGDRAALAAATASAPAGDWLGAWVRRIAGGEAGASEPPRWRLAAPGSPLSASLFGR